MDNLLNECRGRREAYFITGEKTSSVRKVTKDWGHPSVQNELLSEHTAEDYKTKITFLLRPFQTGRQYKINGIYRLEGALNAAYKTDLSKLSQESSWKTEAEI